MQVLVTGATGFVGPAVVTHLRQQGTDVVCLVRPTANTTRLASLGVRLATGDVTQPESVAAALGACDAVIHLAGTTHAHSAAAFAAVNQHGCENVARACAALAQPPRLVVVSSLAAAGPGTVDTPRRECDPCQPVSAYGRSKLAGELAARSVAARVPTSIVRPPIVYGPGDRDGLIWARSIARTGWHAVPRRGLPLSLVHVDDLAAALWLVLERGTTLDPRDTGRGVYHAAHPQPSSLAEIGECIAAAVGCRLRLVKVRPWALASASIAGEFASRLRRRPGALGWDKFRESRAVGWVASSQPLTQNLGWQPQWGHAEGYRQTIDWYRREGWL